MSAPAHATDALAERERVLTGFLEAEQERLARACHDLARAFARGATLHAFGTGAARTDAAHVAVEFMHPVIVGKRALPALAEGLAVARGGDIALALSHGPLDRETAAFLAGARQRGLLTLAMTGGGAPAEADHAFAVPSDDPAVAQEVQETTYHVLWELVHTFFERPGLVEDACVTCGDVAVEARVVALHGATALVERDGGHEEIAVDLVPGVAVGDLLLCHAGAALERLEAPPAGAGGDDDPAGFLYPFLGGQRGGDEEAVIADVRASTVRKGRDTVELRAAIDLDALAACAATLRERLDHGAALMAFGNGGSSTDAQDLAYDARARGWRAVALNDDVATITAVGNDVGFDNVFARQLIALGRPGDVAVAISTSGSSPNVIAALEEARRREMVTVALAGYGGGRLAELPWLDHLLTVPGDYVPRLQEAQATMYHLLLA